jgi:hypothetical protein
MLDIFPYRIHFDVINNIIYIHGIIHTSRDPETAWIK